MPLIRIDTGSKIHRFTNIRISESVMLLIATVCTIIFAICQITTVKLQLQITNYKCQSYYFIWYILYNNAINESLKKNTYYLCNTNNTNNNDEWCPASKE